MRAPQSLVPPLIAIQFVAFGWRLNREITVGDKRNKTWLPLPDYLNLLSFFFVVLLCIVLPLMRGMFGKPGNMMLVVGYSLIAFHPFSEAAHYRLFSKQGRSIYLKVKSEGGDYPWITGQESFSVALSLILASIAAYLAWHSATL